jgi:hypothetical protein
MQETEFLDLLSPWLVMIVILVPLVFAERWVHQHFFGIGYLISKDKMSATRLFYVFFLPGIFIHELIQWLVAGALNVPIKQVVAWPETQENGTLRLDFIVVNDKETDPIRSALVAAAPFMIMAVMVWYISTQILDLHAFTESLGSGDIEIIWTRFQELFRSSNFILWMYLLFVLANSMVPKRSEARGIPLLLGILVAGIVVMVVIGLDAVLIETFGGPVSEALDLVNTALLTILVMDVIAILLLGITEDTLERFRGFKMDYSGGESITRTAGKKKRQPGSDEPIPKGEPLPSIYSIALPLPDPAQRPRGARPAAAGAGISVRETSARVSDSERPGLDSPRPSVLERAGASEGATPERSFGVRDRDAESPGEGERPASRFGAPRDAGDTAARPASSFGRTGDAGERPASGFGADRDASDTAARPASSFGRTGDAGERPASGFGADRDASDTAARPASSFGRTGDAGERPASGFGASREAGDAGERPASRFGADRAAASDTSGRPASRFGANREEQQQERSSSRRRLDDSPQEEKSSSSRRRFGRGGDDKPAQPSGRFSRGGDSDKEEKRSSSRGRFGRRGDDSPQEEKSSSSRFGRSGDDSPARPTGRFGSSRPSERPLERPPQPARPGFGRPTREEPDEDLEELGEDFEFDEFNQDIYEDE